MAEFAKTLEIRSSPHIVSGHSVDTIMFNVVLALLPTTAYAVWLFGLAALATFVIPGLNFLCLPWLVASGTLLALEVGPPEGPSSA